MVVRIEKVTVVEPVKDANAPVVVKVVGEETVMLASAAIVAVTVVVPVDVTANALNEERRAAPMPAATLFQSRAFRVVFFDAVFSTRYPPVCLICLTLACSRVGRATAVPRIDLRLFDA